MQKFWESIYRPSYITGYNPFIIKNMNRAIERMVEAINNREKIVIYGGTDADSLCGIASLLLILKYLNADVEYCIGEYDYNYAILTDDIIKNQIAFLGAQLLITVGAGIKGKEQEILCNNLGIDLVITENKEVKSSYESIYINPREEGCAYRYKNLSNSGVSFKLMQAIAIYYNMKSINKYLDLIFLGGVYSKITPKGENNVILKEGIKVLKTTNNVGLQAVKNFYDIDDIDEDNLNKIIEAINPSKGAVGKRDNARIIVELLTTNDKSRAEQITKYLDNEKKR
ncbi:hypothetical protein SAMN02745163_00033 [Clostridium cavendishii DSM 21758]|uniref:DDH domain-containing protein n=1 Tax=Clostridium cavendishii DSM 21758 TaxID=1121302 RepID=A0A1M6AAW9_9CLOT|nr:DHH family phosphoesterase [Clostridium cavendishii]SHI33576.1 hypothetical protein SAMN02745163_00033 [Clostridium cavendishii DSM 21758]